MAVEPPRMQKMYQETIAQAVAEKFSISNRMAIPKLVKIVVNMGVGRATQDKGLLESAVKAMEAITGQKPVVTRARVSVANFKLREGNPIGCKVTLRGARMFEFLDRLITLALPRIRDFRGISATAFDGNGNYTLGLVEHAVFPEIEADRVTQMHGMDITFVTSNADDDKARELLSQFGMPFAKSKSRAKAG